MKREYPCQVFILGSSSFIVRKTTLTRPYSEKSDNWGAYTKGGQFYRDAEIFDTAKLAIKAGRAKIKTRKKALERALVQLNEQSAALDKAEAAA